MCGSFFRATREKTNHTKLLLVCSFSARRAEKLHTIEKERRVVPQRNAPTARAKFRRAGATIWAQQASKQTGERPIALVA